MRERANKNKSEQTKQPTRRDATVRRLRSELNNKQHKNREFLAAASAGAAYAAAAGLLRIL